MKYEGGCREVAHESDLIFSTRGGDAMKYRAVGDMDRSVAIYGTSMWHAFIMV
jgi:hypothetical protein